jgi:hypothetical protein
VPLLADLATGTDTLACNPKPGPTVPTGNYIITVILKKLVPDASVP